MAAQSPESQTTAVNQLPRVVNSNVDRCYDPILGVAREDPCKRKSEPPEVAETCMTHTNFSGDLNYRIFVKTGFLHIPDIFIHWIFE